MLAAFSAGIVGWESLSPASSGPRFALVDAGGNRVTANSYRNKFLLVYFGYTHCPDACPTALNEMAEALDALGPRAAAVQPLFVTLDPARDTPALLTDYVRNFDSRIVPLTGTPSQIAEAAKAFRIAYDIRRGDSRGGDYFVDHSSVLTLIGRDGRYVTTLAANLPGAAIATQLRSLLGSAAKEDLT